MRGKLVLHTTQGSFVSKTEDLTKDEAKQMREELKFHMGSKLSYLEIDTYDGWVVVNGPQVIAAQLKLED